MQPSLGQPHLTHPPPPHRRATPEPILDKDDARPDEHVFQVGGGAEKLLQLGVVAKAHDALHARPVVPGPVKHNNFSARRQVLQVALVIEGELGRVVGWVCSGRQVLARGAESMRARSAGGRPSLTPPRPTILPSIHSLFA